MKLLLVCAGGMSTSILMKKLEKYAAANGPADFEVIAKGLGDYEDYYKDYDVIMLGPQVSYKIKQIQETTNMPVGVVVQLDYALGNAEHIFKAIDKLLAEWNSK
jgi:PTS system cellobiose-specific IIB component